MMSAAEVIAEIQTLTPAERASVIEKTLPQLSVEQLKLIDRQLRRLANPEVPDSFWDGTLRNTAALRARSHPASPLMDSGA